VHVIHGNNSGDLYSLARLANREGSNIHYHGMDAGVELAGRRIFLVHYPHYARAMATTGDWDLVCCGHSHKVQLETLDNIKGGKTLLANPGTIGGVGRAPATYLLADLERLQFEVHEIDKAIEREAGY
jgi:predicted phosphodiesterase